MNELTEWLDVMVYTPTNKQNQNLLRQQSLDYIRTLGKWQQHLLFYYTINSTPINTLLIRGIKGDTPRRFRNWTKG